MKEALKKLNTLAESYGFTERLRGVNHIKPIKLTYLDDFQYLQEVTNKEVLTEKDITTVLKAVLSE